MIFSTPAPYSEERLGEMLARNAEWVSQITAQDPDYFKRLSAGQSPAFTVISCCDSRADPNTLLQSNLGELFVYKNVANQAGLNDLSLQTAIQFSIDSLKVKHLLVFGHHNCGGVRIALGLHAGGSPGDWLEGVRELAHDHQLFNPASPEEAHRNVDKLCEPECDSAGALGGFEPGRERSLGAGRAGGGGGLGV